MVSPNNPGPKHDDQSMYEVAVHEMTHIFVAMKAQNIPLWLNEGVACYEAGQHPLRRDGNYIVVIAKNRGIPKFKALEGDSNTFAHAGGYPFSYTLAGV